MLKDFFEIVDEIYKKDSRYKPDAYEFLMQALKFTQGRLKKQGHITGKELSEGCAAFAIDQYGPMATVVLNHWGITKTEDFGNIVYNMIDYKLFSKSEGDSKEDFKDIYDFSAVFGSVLLNAVKETIKNK